MNNRINGIRGNYFKKFLKSILEISKIKKTYIDTIVDEYMNEYITAFTHKDYDSINNYEFFELLGDGTCNKSISWYLSKRFPSLNNSNGVKVLARLRINLVSGKNFAKLADKLNFEKYISYTQEVKEDVTKNILEDCFEAFIGVTEFVFDKEFGIGYKVCYNIISNLLDKEYISLQYDDLYDSITRLKETFDYYSSLSMNGTCPYIWGKISFKNKKDLETGIHNVYLIQNNKEKEEVISHNKGTILDITKQELSQKYLDFLKEKGYFKKISQYYLSIKDDKNQFPVK